MTRFRCTTFLLCSFWYGLLPSAAMADTLIHFTTKTSSSSFTQNEDLTLSGATGYIIQIRPGVTGKGVLFYASPVDPSGTTYGFEFAAPSGSALVVGNYPVTTTYPSETSPGFDFFGDYEITTSSGPGSFRVLEISYKLFLTTARSKAFSN